MGMLFYTIFIVVGLLVLLCVIWRLSSSRWQLPCPAFLGWMVEVDNPFTKINRAATIIDHLELKPGMIILDAGCGPGRVTIPLAQKIGSQGKMVALDIQQEMLDKVKEKAQRIGLNNISFVQAGLGDGKLDKNMYDRILLVTVLGEIPNQKKALQEIFQALKPNGILSITETMFDPHYQRLSGVLNLAQEIGFKKKNIVSDFFSYNLLLEKPAYK